MILTTLETLDRYAALHPAFPEAFAALRGLAAKPFQTGVTQVDGQRIYINAISYETKAEECALLEAHRRYIDVMYIASGQERIAYSPVSEMGVLSQPYEEAGDAQLSPIPPERAMLRVKAGRVILFFPEDAHGPGITLDAPQHVEKMIVKVLLETPAETGKA